MKPWQAVVVVCVSLIPSAHNAWLYRDQPHLGRHDDGFYFTAARSLTQGEYRIESLPGRPFQTKYPPGFPLYLAPVWLMNPEFPGNLALATLFAWLPLPVVVWLCWHLFRRYGFSVKAATALACLVAVNPYSLILSSMMMSELVFTAVLLGVVLLVDGEGGQRRAAAAGMLAAFGYLTRTAALPLLAAAPLVYLLRYGVRGGLRRAACFAGPFLMAAGGWHAWVAAHRGDGRFPYDTDYLGYFLANIGLDNILPVAWQNASALLMSFYGLFFFEVGAVVLLHLLLRFVAFAAVAGVIRQARRGGLSVYTVFAGGTCVMLVLWHFPPTERMVYPLLPLLMAGLAAEVRFLWTTLRAALSKPSVAERAIAACLLAGIVGVSLYMASRTAVAALRLLPEGAAAEREWARDRRELFAWAAGNIRTTAGFQVYRDTEFHLLTGLPAARMHVPTRLRYAGEREAVIDSFAGWPLAAQRDGLTHALVTKEEWNADLLPEERDRVLGQSLNSRLLRPLHTGKDSWVFAIGEDGDAPAGSASLSLKSTAGVGRTSDIASGRRAGLR
ncbi:MAG: hypothetical protein SFV54_13860 [Bryobacteraceae bacterium]|nr:hypothetical protein [Bryobacteraceae bacterium]